MSKFACRCGEVMTLTTRWEDNVRYLVLNRQIEKVGNEMISNPNFTDNDYYDLINEGCIEVLYCTKCGRLWLSDEGEPTYTAYCKEEE